MKRCDVADENETSWAAEEFADVNLGDKRLDARLIMLCNRFSDAPESPINQACADWAETKAAYRFFQNDNVEVGEMLLAHRCKTAQRVKGHKTVLALQDTSYFVYTNHPKTKGLGKMSLKKGKNVKKIYSNGLMVHTCLAVTTAGLPLGLLDQKIFSRKLRQKKTRKAKPHDHLPVEEKESYRWLEALDNTKAVTGDTEIVTVCDREADLYDLFKLSEFKSALPFSFVPMPTEPSTAGPAMLKRASRNYGIICGNNPKQGPTRSNIPNGPKPSTARSERHERPVVTYGSVPSAQSSPQQRQTQHEDLPDIDMNAVYVLEPNPPDGEEPVEWMLLTNLPVMSFEEAYEKVRWYCLRWRIEMYFKVLKSGFRVEACRLGHADRLTRYLAVMSIVAWRLFMITLIARTDPAAPCSTLLADHEWKVLFLKATGNRSFPRSHRALAMSSSGLRNSAAIWPEKATDRRGRSPYGEDGSDSRT